MQFMNITRLQNAGKNHLFTLLLVSKCTQRMQQCALKWHYTESSQAHN